MQYKPVVFVDFDQIKFSFERLLIVFPAILVSQGWAGKTLWSRYSRTYGKEARWVSFLVNPERKDFLKIHSVLCSSVT